jgi:hypothetical protein
MSSAALPWRGDAEGVGGILNGKPGEVAKLHEFGILRLDLREEPERIVECHEVFSRFGASFDFAKQLIERLAGLRRIVITG